MKANCVDITGRVYGDLTAISSLGVIRTGAKSGTTWLWRCVCGTEVQYVLARVVRGHTLSCGCRRSRNNIVIKTCRHCGLESLRLNKHRNPCSVCHECSNKIVRKYADGNPTMKLLHSARRRAKVANVPFSLTKEDIKVPDVCPVLGIRLAFAKGACTDNSPTLDRIIPAKGYVKGNVAVISFRANTIKSCGSVDEHRQVVEWMEAFLSTPFLLPTAA